MVQKNHRRRKGSVVGGGTMASAERSLACTNLYCLAEHSHNCVNNFFRLVYVTGNDWHLKARITSPMLSIDCVEPITGVWGQSKFSPFPKMSFRTSLHATKSLTTAESLMQPKRSLWTRSHRRRSTLTCKVRTLLPYSIYVIACGFINNNEFILPKTVCFVTVHWCQSWGPRVECMVPPQPCHWGAVPPAPPSMEKN